jgi:hypothetical protein
LACRFVTALTLFLRSSDRRSPYGAVSECLCESVLMARGAHDRLSHSASLPRSQPRLSVPCFFCPRDRLDCHAKHPNAAPRRRLQGRSEDSLAASFARERWEPPKREPRHPGGSKRRGREALRPGGHSQFKGPLIITSVAFGRSIEYERIICEVLGRHLVRGDHHFKWIKRCRRGDTGLAGGHRRPSCDERHHQSGGADCEQCLGHLSSPCPVPNLCR